MKEKISIIIPICGGLEYLEKTIPEIINLNYSNYEVIIADNSPNNKLVKYLKKYDIKYIKTIPKSKTIAANQAAKIAKGTFLLFLDADALIKDKDILKKLIQKIKKDVQVCFSIRFSNINGKYEGLGGRLLIPSREIRNLFLGCKKKSEKEILDYPQGFAFFLKKEVWEEIGGYDEKIPFGCEEIDIGFKLKQKKIKCYLFEETKLLDIGIPQGQMEKGTDTLLDSKKFGLRISGKIFVLKKYYSNLDLIIIIPLLFFYHLLISIRKTVLTKNFDYIKQVIKSYFKY